jgi:ABC-2 type transport system ATP-binding protein
LFLDEPTQGLDPQTRATIWEYLKSLQKEVGTTLFMTTHYMDEAEYCDRIAIIDDGKIIASGTPAELKRGIGGDVITLTSDDNPKMVEQIKAKLGVEATTENGQLHFEVANGAEFVPKIFAAVDIPIKTVTVRQPSLEDVFLKLTGRAIRDNDAGTSDLKMMGRMWGAR